MCVHVLTLLCGWSPPRLGSYLPLGEAVGLQDGTDLSVVLDIRNWCSHGHPQKSRMNFSAFLFHLLIVKSGRSWCGLCAFFGFFQSNHESAWGWGRGKNSPTLKRRLNALRSLPAVWLWLNDYQGFPPCRKSCTEIPVCIIRLTGTGYTGFIVCRTYTHRSYWLVHIHWRGNKFTYLLKLRDVLKFLVLW